MNLIFVRGNTHAVGRYRSEHPCRALQALGHNTRLFTLGKEAERVTAQELLCDVLVLGRITSPSVLDLRDKLPAELRPVTVYEIDDDPWEWHAWDPIHIELGYDYGVKVREGMARSDALLCSTPFLAQRIRREFPNKPLWVVPNSIDFAYRNWAHQEERAPHNLEGKLVLGWTGSAHHWRDGDTLIAALPTVFDKYPDTVFLMQCDRPIYYEWTKGLSKKYQDRLRWVPPLMFEQHPAIYSLLDINLAPLLTSKFNTCKSDLRLIEGGAHGVPYVASKIAPYLEFHRITGGIGGHIADTPGEWLEGISKLIDEEREGRGQSLKRYVQECRSLSVVAGQWQTALEGALAGGRGVPVAALADVTRNAPCPCGAGAKYKRCCSPAYG